MLIKGGSSLNMRAYTINNALHKLKRDLLNNQKTFLMDNLRERTNCSAGFGGSTFFSLVCLRKHALSIYTDSFHITPSSVTVIFKSLSSMAARPESDSLNNH